MRYPLIVVITFSLVASLQAQPERLILRTYTTVDGLPSNAVTSIIQDSIGIVWVATEKGIVGSYREEFAIARSFSYQYHHTGEATFADSRSENGFLLVNTGGDAKEVAYMSVRSGYEWQGYDLRDLFPEWDGDSTGGKGFTAIVETHDRKIVLGTAGAGLWVRGMPDEKRRRDGWMYRGSPMRYVPFAGTVTDLACDSSGNVWVGTTRGLFRLDRDRLVPAEGRELQSARITTLFTDAGGVLWIGTQRGLYLRQGGNVHKHPAMGVRHVTAIAEAPDGDMWLGTSTTGIVRLRGTTVASFGTRDGLPSQNVHVVYADGSGNIWVGTDRGLAKILPHTYYEYITGHDVPEGRWTSGLQAADGSLWFGGKGALVRFTGLKQRSWVAPGALRGMTFRQLIEDEEGAVWALTERGVVRFDGRSFRFFQDDSARPEELRSSVMAYHARQGLLVLSPRAIRRLHGSTFETVAVPAGPRSFNDAAFDISGNLWYTSWSGCAQRTVDGRTIPYPVLKACIKVLPLADGSVAIVDQDYGVVFQKELEAVRTDSIPATWRGSEYPIYSYPFTDGFVTPGGKRFVFYRVTVLRDQVSPGQSYGSIDVDNQGIMTPMMHRDDGTALMLQNTGTGFVSAAFDPFRGILIPQPLMDAVILSRVRADEDSPNYDDLAGATAVHWNKLFEDRDGTVWCATSSGILALPRRDEPKLLLPPVVTSIQAGDQRLLPGLVSTFGSVSAVSPWTRNEKRGNHAGFEDSVRLVLPAEDNDLQFSAYSLMHAQELGTIFQARLDSRDTGWSAPSVEAVFSYRDVPQGTYTFRVRSLTSTGRVSPERTVILSIIVPFWRSTWFAVITVVTVGYLFARGSTERIRRLREEHARVTKQAVHENELQMARTMQMGMLPDRCPEIPGYDIAARSLPATEVGGDFFDFITEGSRVGIAVGDVSGHGITGAMIVGMARTSLRFASSRFEKPSRVLTLANERLRKDISRNVFIAMFYGVLDPKRRSLQYICAGQPTPVLIRKGVAAFLPQGRGDRFPLGIVSNVSYREERLVLRSGDTVVLYTDGFVEAMNGAREEFGFDRFLQTLQQHADKPSTDLIDAVVAEVTLHAHGVPQEDDMTIVAVRVRKENRS